MLLGNVVGAWGVVIFVLSMTHVVGGVLLWVICVFRCVVVCWPVANRIAVFCVICSLLTLCLMLVVTIWWKRTRV